MRRRFTPVSNFVAYELVSRSGSGIFGILGSFSSQFAFPYGPLLGAWLGSFDGGLQEYRSLKRRKKAPKCANTRA